MRTKGQIAYEAYLQKCGGVSLVSGAPLPKWEEQAPAIQEAWEAAGEAVTEANAGLDYQLERRAGLLTFSRFSAMNRMRCESPRGFNHALNSWSLSDWMTATMGELGEAANIVKKLNRVRDGIPGNKETAEQLQTDLGLELADTFTYLDLTCQAAKVCLPVVTLAKFREKSAEIGYSDPFDLED